MVPGMLVGIVVTSTAAVATIFFAPGVMAIFLTSASVLCEGTAGVAFAWTVVGIGAVFSGGGAGLSVMKVVKALTDRSSMLENPTPISAPLQPTDNSQETPLEAKKINDKTQEQLPDATQDEPPEPLLLLPAASTPTSELRQDPTSKGAGVVNQSIVDLIKLGGVTLRRIPKFQGLAMWELSSKQLAMVSGQTRHESFAQRVREEHFGGAAPDEMTDPCACEKYKLLIKIAEHEATQVSNGGNLVLEDARNLGMDRVLALAASKRAYDESQKKLARIQCRDRLKAATEEMRVPIGDIPKIIQDLQRMEQLEMDIRAFEDSEKANAVLGTHGVSDLTTAERLRYAQEKVLDCLSPNNPKIARASLRKHIDVIKGGMAGLSTLATSVSTELDKVKGLIEMCDTFDRLCTVEIKHISSARMQAGSDKGDARMLLHIKSFINLVEDVRNAIATVIPKKDSDSVEYIKWLVARNDPDMSIGVLMKFRTLPKKQSTADRPDGLEQQIAELRDKLGGDDKIAKFKKLFASIDVRCDSAGQQTVREYCEEIEQAGRNAQLQSAARLDPKTSSGIWLMNAAKGAARANSELVIPGRDDDLDPCEIGDYETFVVLLTNLLEANEGNLDVIRRQLFDNDPLATLICNNRGKDVENEESARKIIAAIIDEDARGLVKAFFGGSEWWQ